MRNQVQATVLSLGLAVFASEARADGSRRYDVEPGQAMVNVTLGSSSQISAVSLGLAGSLRESGDQLRAELNIPLDSFGNGRAAADAKARAAISADQFPTLTFQGTAPAPDKDGRTRFTGTLTLHGVSQKVEVQATLSRIGDRIYAHASFPLSLHKFGVAIPGFGELLHIDLDAGLRPVPEPLASRG